MTSGRRSRGIGLWDCRVWDLGDFWAPGFKVSRLQFFKDPLGSLWGGDLGFRARGLGFRVRGLGFRAWGLKS